MAVTDTLTEISSAAELTDLPGLIFLERHYGPQYEELLYG